MPWYHLGDRAAVIRDRSLAVARFAMASVVAAACRPASPPDDASRSPLPPARSVLSADANRDSVVARCLANDSGVVTRHTDTEPYVAADPRDARRLIAAWQTLSGSGAVVQYARSSDGGRTWTPPRAVPINACAGGPVASATRASDPWAAIGPDGRAYLSAIAWTPSPSDGPDLVSALVVVASPDGGATWDSPVAVAIAPAPDVAHDNLAVTADPTRPRTLYAATTRIETPSPSVYHGRLGFTRSDDGGVTWLPIRPITAAIDDERIGAPQIVVHPRTGTLYAVYHRSRRGEPSIVGVLRSDDRGDTWSDEVVAAPHVSGARPNHPITNRRFVIATDIVQATVSPASGRLVIAYADARRNPGGRGDVSLVWSDDGRRWSRPVAVSDSTENETAWLPAIAARGDGEVAVTYFASDFTARGDSGTLRLRLHRYRDGPRGLEPLAASELDRASLVWPGDYHALAATGDGYVDVYGREGDIAATLVLRRSTREKVP